MNFVRGSLFSFLLLLGILVLIGCKKPPEDLLHEAKSAMDSAAVAGALKYAESSYRQAEATLQQGWMEIARQKARLSPFRDFKVADSLLCRAKELALQSRSQTLNEIQKLKNKAQSEQNVLKNELNVWREALDGSLLLEKAERHWSEAELGLLMCQHLIENAEYDAALKAVSDSHASLKQLGNLLAEYANDESKQISQWRTWVRETLDDSRTKRQYSVIVDKSAHNTYLIRNGTLAHTYPCEIGYNSARQKLFAGDGATPEGKYQVIEAKSNGSKYYKALLLDYPNQLDQQRFQHNKSKGIISRHAKIGKYIEIHGDGGRNKDWTEGCVALTNSDMDHIMKYVTTGTPVTIVRRSDQFP